MLSVESKTKSNGKFSSGMYQNRQGICQVFASGKYCRFGKHCRYLHIRKPPFSEPSEGKHQYGVLRSGDNFEQVVGGPYLSQSGQSHEENGSLRRRNDQHQGNQSLNNSSKLVPRKKCRYFANGYCAKGSNCTFLHILIPSNDVNVTSPNETFRYAEEEKKVSGVVTDDRNICQFFNRGYCRNGRSCRLVHDCSGYVSRGSLKSKDIADESNRPKFIATFTPKVEFDIEGLTPEKIQNLRDKELVNIRKRFPNGESDRDGSHTFNFFPTDPDWPYDVKHVRVQVEYPDGYPLKPLVFTLTENEQLPETVKRFIWKSTDEWIHRRFDTYEQNGKAELVTRELLRWFDRKLESLFTDGLKVYQKELMAKSAGIEFVTAAQLREEFAKHSSGSDEGSDEEEDDYDSSDDEEGVENDPLIANPNHSNQLEAGKHGTEVKLQHLQIKDNASSLMVDRVSIIVQCGRCKNKTEFYTPPGRINVFGCAKCGAEQLVTFRANMAHSFTSVIGYLDLKDCIVHDMILSECNFKVGCLECGRDMNFGGIIPGQLKETWCHSCHSKLTVAAESAKFLNLQQIDIATEDIHRLNIKKVKKVPKDPAIKEGSPLPSEGTCKHYKKSFRWLRFPCCGKAYPCDLCHDENEGHEFIFANRMICGFCCKEQTFSPDRPCKSCSSSLTKKASSHWEGGKGCRDKVKMSRNDEAKFKNMNKTISRKQQEKSATTKKTKLRHA